MRYWYWVVVGGDTTILWCNYYGRNSSTAKWPGILNCHTAVPLIHFTLTNNPYNALVCSCTVLRVFYFKIEVPVYCLSCHCLLSFTPKFLFYFIKTHRRCVATIPVSLSWWCRHWRPTHLCDMACWIEKLSLAPLSSVVLEIRECSIWLCENKSLIIHDDQILYFSLLLLEIISNTI